MIQARRVSESELRAETEAREAAERRAIIPPFSPSPVPLRIRRAAYVAAMFRCTAGSIQFTRGELQWQAMTAECAHLIYDGDARADIIGSVGLAFGLRWLRHDRSWILDLPGTFASSGMGGVS